MEEVLRFYNLVVEGLNNSEDTVLRMNDLVRVYILLVKKALEIEEDNNKRIMIIDSVKNLTNNLVSEIANTISEAEMKTIDSNE